MHCHKPGKRLVRFDPQWASRQFAGQNLTGSTGQADIWRQHVERAERNERSWGRQVSAPINPSLIDDILSEGTRTTYRAINDTVKVGAPNLCGKWYIVVDA